MPWIPFLIIVAIFLLVSSLTLNATSICNFTYMYKYTHRHNTYNFIYSHTCTERNYNSMKHNPRISQYNISKKVGSSLYITLHFSMSPVTSPSSGCPGVLLNVFLACDIKTFGKWFKY